MFTFATSRRSGLPDLVQSREDIWDNIVRKKARKAIERQVQEV
jgi:hypothetical protein